MGRVALDHSSPRESDQSRGSGLYEKRKMLEGVAAGFPLGCMGEANDLAYAALYLGSGEFKYITGTEFTIDGGFSW